MYIPNEFMKHVIVEGTEKILLSLSLLLYDWLLHISLQVEGFFVHSVSPGRNREYIIRKLVLFLTTIGIVL